MGWPAWWRNRRGHRSVRRRRGRESASASRRACRVRRRRRTGSGPRRRQPHGLEGQFELARRGAEGRTLRSVRRSARLSAHICGNSCSSWRVSDQVGQVAVARVAGRLPCGGWRLCLSAIVSHAVDWSLRVSSRKTYRAKFMVLCVALLRGRARVARSFMASMSRRPFCMNADAGHPVEEVLYAGPHLCVESRRCRGGEALAALARSNR